MDVKDCKYRLPCNRCDKYDRQCEHIEFLIAKENYEEMLKKQECSHDWHIEIRASDYVDAYGNKYCGVHKHCLKCGCTDITMQQIKT